MEEREFASRTCQLYKVEHLLKDKEEKTRSHTYTQLKKLNVMIYLLRIHYFQLFQRKHYKK